MNKLEILYKPKDIKKVFLDLQYYAGDIVLVAVDKTGKPMAGDYILKICKDENDNNIVQFFSGFSNDNFSITDNHITFKY